MILIGRRCRNLSQLLSCRGKLVEPFATCWQFSFSKKYCRKAIYKQVLYSSTNPSTLNNAQQIFEKDIEEVRTAHNDLRDLQNQGCGVDNTATPIKETNITCLSSTPPYYYTFPLIVGTQDILISGHDFTGLPWWAIIVFTTIVLRFSITLPLARLQAITLAKVELLQPTLNEVIDALKHNISIKGKRSGQSAEEVDRTFRQEARLYTRDIYKREKCNPLKLYFLPWVQLPLWITISLALRNISGYFPKESGATDVLPCSAELKTEGMFWLTDLTVSDPYFILPVIIGISNLMNIELNTLKRQAPSKKQLIITRVFRFLTIGMVLAASQVPSAMSLYWATSSSYGLAQNLAVLHPKVRRKLGIPKAPSESSAPIQERLFVLKSKFQQFMQIQRKQ